VCRSVVRNIMMSKTKNIIRRKLGEEPVCGCAYRGWRWHGRKLGEGSGYGRAQRGLQGRSHGLRGGHGHTRSWRSRRYQERSGLGCCLRVSKIRVHSLIDLRYLQDGHMYGYRWSRRSRRQGNGLSSGSGCGQLSLQGRGRVLFGLSWM
jgi:hypothetical protein